MISHTTEKFRKLFFALPLDIQSQAKVAYSRFKNDPYHPSLQFKRVHSNEPIYSARITMDYRAVGLFQENAIIWFWIGSHTEYEKLLQKL